MKADNEFNSTAIVKDIGLSREFLDQHKSVIIERFGGALLNAWRHLKTRSHVDYGNAHVFALNQCLHLASSIVMLGGEQSQLRATMDRLTPFAQKHSTDVSTLISIAVLAHLFTKADLEAWAPDKGLKDRLRRVRPKDTPHDFKIVVELRRRFEGVNWMIGAEAARAMILNTSGK